MSDTLLKLSKPAPRYTSYPTAPEWSNLSPETYSHYVRSIQGPLSLYFHIPFCKTMCLYCGCSVILNRRPENEERYVDYLMREIEIACSHFSERKVTQMHFGGGTPTKLSIPLFEKLYRKIEEHFDLCGEIAIEIDPRTVTEDGGRKLRFLKELGFNRVSFGVQDTNWKVQETVKRRQSLEMTQKTYAWARELNFEGVNIDLIYGLPHQTVQTFRETVQHILEMKPDRISLFSYAKVPWLKKHQLAIKEKTLPSTEEKFQIYQEARAAFVKGGYVAIGMDHFALENDEIAVCYRQKQLQRNFQGYSAKLAQDQLGFGVTAIGFVQNCYGQNLKSLPDYYAAIDRNELPVHRGCELSTEDVARKWLIHTLMSDFCIDKREFERRFDRPYNFVLKDCHDLVVETDDHLLVTKEGELFIRNIAMNFDAYLKETKTPKFSQSI